MADHLYPLTIKIKKTPQDANALESYRMSFVGIVLPARRDEGVHYSFYALEDEVSPADGIRYLVDARYLIKRLALRAPEAANWFQNRIGEAEEFSFSSNLVEVLR